LEGIIINLLFCNTFDFEGVEREFIGKTTRRPRIKIFTLIFRSLNSQFNGYVSV